MQIQQKLMKNIENNKVFYLFLCLGIFLLLNIVKDPGIQADKELNTPIVTVQSGVFIEKYNQHPVFTWGSKVSALEDISLNKDTLISLPYHFSEGLPEKAIGQALEGQKKGLHLLVHLTEQDLKNKDFSEMMDKMSHYNLSFWVSLIPEQELSQKEYNKFYDKLWSHLNKNDIQNVSLVLYPAPFFPDSVEENDWDELDGVGVNISIPEDLVKLDKIYTLFADKKDIIINENIIDSHPHDIKKGMDFLEEFYYSLAVKYPSVTLVFQSSDLSRADQKYRLWVDGFKEKTWVTATALETTNIPVFEALARDMVLTDQVEFLYRPQDDNYGNIAYVEYKFNTGTIIQENRPPFAITVDTNKLHNGINSLVTVVYNKQLKIINKQQIYFEVGNENIPPRAKRIGKSYIKEQKPAYTRSYIPVLMYHNFALKVSKDRASNTVSADLFERQLKALLDQGYTPVNFYDLDQYLNKKAGLPKKPVIITADDGYLSNYAIAYPILKKYRVSATFFVTTAYMGIKTGSPHFTWAQAKEMEESGLIDIQSHTHKHLLVNGLSEEEAVYETSISFGLIEKNLGKRDVKVFAYPEFKNTADSRKWVKGQGVDLQITNLATKQSVTSRQNVQRIHVHNNMSPQELIKTIKKLTI